METLKPLRVVSIGDAALDWPEMAKAHAGNETKYVNALQEYAQSRDPDMVRETPGKQLTWFTVRRIDVDMMDIVLSAPNDYMRNRIALKYGVEHIENLTGLDGLPYARLDPEEERSLGGFKVRHLSERQMRLIAPQYVEEIGGVAYARSFLAPTNGVRFPLPRSWQLVLKTKAHQVVADAAARLKDRTNEPPSDPDSTENSGDAATDAPATGKATKSKRRRSASGGRSKPRKRSSKRSKG